MTDQDDPRPSSRPKTSNLGGLIAAAASLLVGVITAVFFILEPGTGDPLHKREPQSQLQSAIEDQSRAISLLRTQIDSLRTLRDALTDTATATGLRDISQYSLRVSTLDTRLSKIEGVILADPTKSLDLVLIRRDIDELRGNNSDNITAVRRDVDRIYDLSKWIIGLMFTMSIGVLSLAAATIFKDRKTGETKP